MRRLAAIAVVLALHGSVPQGQIQQSDGVARALAELKVALESGRVDGFRAVASASLPEADRVVFERAVQDGPSRATVQERNRIVDGGSTEVLAEVFMSRGRQGRVTTWQISTRKKPGAPDREEVTGLKELAVLDLQRLTLDTTRQFAVHNLTFRAPDFTLTMASGSAFAADADDGMTILVLRGNGAVHFAPPSRAEQEQLRGFAGRPAFETKIDSAFVRLSPIELPERLSQNSLVPTPVDPDALKRAQEIYDDRAPRSFHVDLRELSSDRWSIEPQRGSVVVEFRNGRYGWLTYTRSPTETEDITLFDRAHNRNLSVYASPDSIALHGRFYSEDRDLSYDILAYSLDLTFDPARTWISGRGSLRVKITRDFVGTLTLRLASSLAVSSVSSPGMGRLLALRVIGQNSLIVGLPTIARRNDEIALEIEYSGRLPPQPSSQEAWTTGAGQTGRQDPNASTELSIPAEPRFVYSTAVYWYPQSPVTDYAMATMRVTVPVEYQVVASGAQTASSVGLAPAKPGERGPGRSLRTVEFVADRPVKYLSCVMTRLLPSGTMDVPVPRVAPAMPGSSAAMGDAASAVKLTVYSTPRQVSRNAQVTARVASILRFYASLVGEAPYPNFTVAAVDDNLPGGHSPAYLSVWHQPLSSTPFTWQDDPATFDRYPFFILAHEVAHQWWGASVGWKNYHEQWLSEGLSQYFAWLYAGSDRGPEVARSLLVEMRETAAQYSPQGPIYLGYRLGYLGVRGHVYRGTVYNKSAVVLHMLRRLIGDDAFMAGLRRFYRDWRFNKAGTANLRAAFEAETKIPLARFFDRWVLESAVPRLRVTSRIEPSRDSAVVRVEQLGDVFDLPLTVTLQYADGRSEEITIPVTEAVVEHRIPLKGVVRRIITKDELTLATYVN